MFSVENAITCDAIRQKNPFRVLFSMNVHAVANPEMSLEDARSYVFFTREGAGKSAVHVALHFLRSGRKLFYSHSANPYSEAQASEIEDDARRFSEDLGAMLDEVDFSEMSDTEKADWIGNLEILSDRNEQGANLHDASPAVESPAPGCAAGQDAPVEETSPRLDPDAAQTAAQEPMTETEVQPKPVQLSPTTAERAPDQPETRQRGAAVAATERPAAGRQERMLPSDRDTTSPPREEKRTIQASRRTPSQTAQAKMQKPQLKKDLRNPAGLIGREKEALARLLASF